MLIKLLIETYSNGEDTSVMVEVAELQVRQLLWKQKKFKELNEEYKSLCYLGDFNSETLWKFYSEVIAKCTSDKWKDLKPDSKDLFVHLKFRVQARDIEEGKREN